MTETEKKLAQANEHLARENEVLRAENRLLREKVDHLIRTIHGVKSEKIDPGSGGVQDNIVKLP